MKHMKEDMQAEWHVLHVPISSDSDANAGTQAEVWHQSWTIITTETHEGRHAS